MSESFELQADTLPVILKFSPLGVPPSPSPGPVFKFKFRADAMPRATLRGPGLELSLVQRGH